ncbi:MAG: hypothetical protein ABEJ66_03510 [Candidatus Nanohaloarchaea archaeon]
MDDFFDKEEMEDLPDDIEIEHVEAITNCSSDDYHEEKERFFERVEARMEELDVYDVSFRTSPLTQRALYREAFILYGDSSE